MKKILGLFLACILIFALPLTTQAAEYVPLDLDTSAVVPYAVKSLPFSGLQADKYAYGYDTYYISNGDTTLTVSSCTWSPASQDIMVGFVNKATNVYYGVVFSGGSITPGSVITTANLPDGDYLVVVGNYGDQKISGTLQYSVT